MKIPKPGTTDKCLNCGARVVVVNFALGPRWMHQPAGASFQDGMYEHCRSAVATPRGDS